MTGSADTRKGCLDPIVEIENITVFSLTDCRWLLLMVGSLLCYYLIPTTQSCPLPPFKHHRQSGIQCSVKDKKHAFFTTWLTATSEVLTKNRHFKLFLLYSSTVAFLCVCSWSVHSSYYSVAEQWQLPHSQKCDLRKYTLLWTVRTQTGRWYAHCCSDHAESLRLRSEFCGWFCHIIPPLSLC